MLDAAMVAKAEPILDPKEVVRLNFKALATADVALARRVVAPDHFNHMAADEPPACRTVGLPGFLATGAWLRFAFHELAWEEISILADGDWVSAHMRMSGLHAGPFVVFPPNQSPEVFPPSGRRFEVRQIHLFRVKNGQTSEHIAVRDDLGMMTQLGYIPPTPAVGIKLGTWRLMGKSARAIAEATAVAEKEAARA